MEINKKVKVTAKDLGLFKLLAKISEDDMLPQKQDTKQTVLLNYIANIKIFVRNRCAMTMKEI